ncbi:hypothetical protein O7626_32390 [Micromonospora sp. WMMD1102]|uniref:hypothetical protein n=1 Tax=Micromonospora sp. WMMD1102 TaxID=3016105 RepID=UPI00241521F2|nr:hypothetical protein [Micromonospora sp. WMMD1102]MDG4790559.1 hypothetical protein [Micromonospora sp. WMMD1102]
MTSFPAQARRARDIERSPHSRLLALRECVLHFAPYGFRATWHHLVLNAGIPQRLEQNSGSLLLAIDEVEEARLRWQAVWQPFAERRRTEKAAGQRMPRKSDNWLSWGGLLAWCPNPEVHPTEQLAVVVDRLIGVYSSGQVPPTTCPVCGQFRQFPPCPACGVDPRGPVGAHALMTPASERRWRNIWKRRFAGNP